MKPQNLSSADVLQRLLQRIASRDVDTEIYVLKCHLVVERHMYWLLAQRLEIDESLLPSLQYFSLAKLALGGEPYKSVLVGVLALNDLRNEFSHELDADQLERKCVTFCEKVGVFCPEPVYGVNSAALRDACDTSVKLAAFTCIVRTWVHIAELSLAKNLYASEEEAELARAALEVCKKQTEHMTAQQNAARETWRDFPKS